MRPRISIRAFVRLSVGPSVGRSVGHAFFKNRGNRVLRTTKQVNSSKFKKILSFSHLLDASLFVSNLFYFFLITFNIIRCNLIIKDSIEVPRIIKDGVNSTKKAVAFAVGATGNFWIQNGLQGLKSRT